MEVSFQRDRGVSPSQQASTLNSSGQPVSCETIQQGIFLCSIKTDNGCKLCIYDDANSNQTRFRKDGSHREILLELSALLMKAAEVAADDDGSVATASKKVKDTLPVGVSYIYTFCSSLDDEYSHMKFSEMKNMCTSLLVTTSGEVYGKGVNSLIRYGQGKSPLPMKEGDDDFLKEFIRVDVLCGLGIKKICMGWFFGVALTADRKLYKWGRQCIPDEAVIMVEEYRSGPCHCGSRSGARSSVVGGAALMFCVHGKPNYKAYTASCIPPPGVPVKKFIRYDYGSVICRQCHGICVPSSTLYGGFKINYCPTCRIGVQADAQLLMFVRVPYEIDCGIIDVDVRRYSCYTLSENNILKQTDFYRRLVTTETLKTPSGVVIKNVSCGIGHLAATSDTGGLYCIGDLPEEEIDFPSQDCPSKALRKVDVTGRVMDVRCGGRSTFCFLVDGSKYVLREGRMSKISDIYIFPAAYVEPLLNVYSTMLSSADTKTTKDDILTLTSIFDEIGGGIPIEGASTEPKHDPDQKPENPSVNECVREPSNQLHSKAEASNEGMLSSADTKTTKDDMSTLTSMFDETHRVETPIENASTESKHDPVHGPESPSIKQCVTEPSSPLHSKTEASNEGMLYSGDTKNAKDGIPTLTSMFDDIHRVGRPIESASTESKHDSVKGPENPSTKQCVTEPSGQLHGKIDSSNAGDTKNAKNDVSTLTSMFDEIHRGGIPSENASTESEHDPVQGPENPSTKLCVREPSSQLNNNIEASNEGDRTAACLARLEDRTLENLLPENAAYIYVYKTYSTEGTPFVSRNYDRGLSVLVVTKSGEVFGKGGNSLFNRYDSPVKIPMKAGGGDILGKFEKVDMLCGLGIKKVFVDVEAAFGMALSVDGKLYKWGLFVKVPEEAVVTVENCGLTLPNSCSQKRSRSTHRGKTKKIESCLREQSTSKTFRGNQHPLSGTPVEKFVRYDIAVVKCSCGTLGICSTKKYDGYNVNYCPSCKCGISVDNFSYSYVKVPIQVGSNIVDIDGGWFVYCFLFKNNTLEASMLDHPGSPKPTTISVKIPHGVVIESVSCDWLIVVASSTGEIYWCGSDERPFRFAVENRLSLKLNKVNVPGRVLQYCTAGRSLICLLNDGSVFRIYDGVGMPPVSVKPLYDVVFGTRLSFYTPGKDGSFEDKLSELNGFLVQSRLKSLPPILGKLYGKEAYSDVTLKLADGLFPVHRTILLCKSRYFVKTLANIDNGSTLDLTSHNPRAVRYLLQHLYGVSPTNLDVDDLLDLLELASSWDEPIIAYRVTKSLKAQINEDTVGEIYTRARSLCSSELIGACEELLIPIDIPLLNFFMFLEAVCFRGMP